MRKHITRALVASALLLTLTACSSPEAPPETDDLPAGQTTAMSDEQAAALADGTITAEEYQLSFRRFVSCVEAEGYTIEVGPLQNEIYQYAVPNDAVEAGVDFPCYEKELRQVDGEWQLMHEDTSPQAVALAACIQAAGGAPETTYSAKVDQLPGLGLDLDSCLDEYVEPSTWRPGS